MGRLRRIRGNKSKATPQRIVCWDTETKPERLRDGRTRLVLRVGTAYSFRLEEGVVSRPDLLTFRELGQFWDWLAAKLSWSHPVWCFAHNTGFDLRVVGLKRLLKQGRVTFRHAYRRKGKPAVAKGFLADDDPPFLLDGFLDGRGRVRMVDTLNWFRCSLDDLGRRIGQPKLPLPPDDATDEEWETYCWTDTLILSRVVTDLIEWTRRHDLGMFRPTAPSQARAAWRHRFMDAPVIVHDFAQVRALERDGYYSGRLQQFRRGRVKETLHELDVCGAYNWALATGPFPCSLIDCGEAGEKGNRVVKERPGECLANVLLDTPEEFPVRHPDRSVTWNVGRFWTTLPGPELAYAVNQGFVQRVGKWSRYALGQPFQRFAQFLWGLRKQNEDAGDTWGAELCKLLANSFYGKWGQKTAAWQDDPEFRHLATPLEWFLWSGADGQLRVYRHLGDVAQFRTQPEEHPQAFPAIAAWTTALLRQKLREAIAVAERPNVCYACCDALYVTEAGYKRLWAAGLTGKRQLGQWEHKRSATEAEFLGLNAIEWEGRLEAAGYKHDAEPQQDGSLKWTEFTGFRIGSACGGDHGVVVETVIRKRPAGELRGTVDPTGLIRPLEVYCAG